MRLLRLRSTRQFGCDVQPPSSGYRLGCDVKAQRLLGFLSEVAKTEPLLTAPDPRILAAGRFRSPLPVGRAAPGSQAGRLRKALRSNRDREQHPLGTPQHADT